MTPEQMIAFFLFALVAAVTPGPSNLMVMVAGARGGLIAGLPCLAGVVGGMALMMACGQVGLGSVVHAFPASLVVLKWTGAVFLLWLAWKVAHAGPIGATGPTGPTGPIGSIGSIGSIGTAGPDGAGRANEPRGDSTAASPVGFWKALAFQWVNPKSWIVSVSAAGTYGAGAVAGAGPAALWPALQLAAVFAAAAAPSCLLWLAFGASMQRWLRDARQARRFNIAMGLALAASVLLVLR